MISKFLNCPNCLSSEYFEKLGNKDITCGNCKTTMPNLAGIQYISKNAEQLLFSIQSGFSLWANKKNAQINEINQAIKSSNSKIFSNRLKTLSKAIQFQTNKINKLLSEPLIITLKGHEIPVPDVSFDCDEYFANIHRDWSWNTEQCENQASINIIQKVVQKNTKIKNILVLGAGAGRLSYDIGLAFQPDNVILCDHNPLLLKIAHEMTHGENVELFEFPVSPKKPEDVVRLHKMKNSHYSKEIASKFSFICGDIFDKIFKQKYFDTILTPWLIDILPYHPSKIISRVNELLPIDGIWINFGPLGFQSESKINHYHQNEIIEMLEEGGFKVDRQLNETIPYLASPYSKQFRSEEVWSFTAKKIRNCKKPSHQNTLGEQRWLHETSEPVPVLQEFIEEAVKCKVYSQVLNQINGKRSLDEINDNFCKTFNLDQDSSLNTIKSYLGKILNLV